MNILLDIFYTDVFLPLDEAQLAVSLHTLSKAKLLDVSSDMNMVPIFKLKMLKLQLWRS